MRDSEALFDPVNFPQLFESLLRENAIVKKISLALFASLEQRQIGTNPVPERILGRKGCQ
jgi:hypothetical protein